MKNLISAIGDSLAGLYGSSAVYFGDAEESSTYPYIVYMVQASGPAEYSTCNRAASAIRTTSVQISVWATSSVTASDMIESIIVEIEERGLTMSAGNYIDSKAIDWTVFVDPDREQSGERVWQGVAIIEFTYQANKAVTYSSSSSSSSPLKSSSSSSVSSSSSSSSP